VHQFVRQEDRETLILYEGGGRTSLPGSCRAALVGTPVVIVRRHRASIRAARSDLPRGGHRRVSLGRVEMRDDGGRAPAGDEPELLSWLHVLRPARTGSANGRRSATNPSASHWWREGSGCLAQLLGTPSYTIQAAGSILVPPNRALVGKASLLSHCGGRSKIDNHTC